MSEITHYYGVKKALLEEIQSKLETAGVLSAIVDSPLHNVDDNWVAVEAPLVTAFNVPGDYSTFTVISNPWEKLKDAFPQIIELYVEEDQKDWNLTTGLNGVQRNFKFQKDLPTEISSDDQTYLTELFSIPFEQLKSVLKHEKAYEFCQKIKIPYLEMEDQDNLQDILSQYGKVIFTSQLAD